MARERYEQVIDNNTNIDEIMYMFAMKAISEAGIKSSEMAESYWGMSLSGITIAKTNLTQNKIATDLEQGAINDVTKITFLRKAKEFLKQNKSVLKDSSIIREQDIAKIFAFVHQITTTQQSINEATLIHCLELLFENAENKNQIIELLSEKKTIYDENLKKNINVYNATLQNLLKEVESFKKFYKEDFIKNKNDRLILVKSNESLQAGIKKLVLDIDKHNKNTQNKKIENINLNRDYFNGKYNFDSILIHGNTILADEIKSGMSQLTSKYSANHKNIKNKIDALTMILANTSIAGEILFDVDKKAWKASNEYRDFKNQKDQSEENKDKFYTSFVERIIMSTLNISTIPEIYVHTIINKDRFKPYTIQLKEAGLDKSLVKTLNSYTEEVDLKHKLIQNFCQINGHVDSYSIQITQKLAMPYIDNEVREINYFAMVEKTIENIKSEYKLQNKVFPKKEESELLKKLYENYEAHNKISYKDIYTTIQDFKAQFEYLIENNHSEIFYDKDYNEILDKKNLFDKVHEKINESFDEKILEIYNRNNNVAFEQLTQSQKNTVKLTNFEMIDIHYRMRENLKEVIGIKGEKLLKADAINILTKNIYEYMDLNKLLVDKDKQMFNIEKIINNQTPKLGISYKQLLEKESVSTQNPIKIQKVKNELLMGELNRNLSNIAKSMAEFTSGNVFRNLCAGTNWGNKTLKSKDGKLDFIQCLARGRFDEKPEMSNEQLNNVRNYKYDVISRTTGLGVGFVKLCSEITAQLEKEKVNSYDVLKIFAYSNSENKPTEIEGKLFNFKEEVFSEMINTIMSIEHKEIVNKKEVYLDILNKYSELIQKNERLLTMGLNIEGNKIDESYKNKIEFNKKTDKGMEI